MAIQIYKNGPTQGLKTFICDKEEDIENLPTNIKMGCMAYIIATGNVYIINSEGEWISQFGDGEDSSGSSEGR